MNVIAGTKWYIWYKEQLLAGDVNSTTWKAGKHLLRVSKQWSWWETLTGLSLNQLFHKSTDILLFATWRHARFSGNWNSLHCMKLYFYWTFYIFGTSYSVLWVHFRLTRLCRETEIKGKTGISDRRNRRTIKPFNKCLVCGLSCWCR